MTSVTAICNQALAHLGEARITSIEDATNPARWCKSFYESQRDALLEGTEWTFAIKRKVISSPVSPAPAWGYTYGFLIPSDCLSLKVVRQDDDPRAANNLIWSREGDQIHTDASTIYIRYIRKVEDPLLFSPSFVDALSRRLAWCLAIPIARSRGLDEHEAKAYQASLEEAQAADGQQGSAERIRSQRLIQARDRDGSFGQYAGPTV